MKQRFDWLDLWRSLAVLTMLAFHALWDLEQFGVLAPGTMETPAADVIRYLGGGSFILISGIIRVFRSIEIIQEEIHIEIIRKIRHIRDLGNVGIIRIIWAGILFGFFSG